MRHTNRALKLVHADDTTARRPDVKTVLVVDDNADGREALTHYLEVDGYKVLQARNGKEAIAVAIEHRPDMILMDLMMPVMDGVQATAELRLHKRTRSIPIVAISGFRKLADYENKGFDDYLVKPVAMVVLADVIARHVRAAMERA